MKKESLIGFSGRSSAGLLAAIVLGLIFSPDVAAEYGGSSSGASEQGPSSEGPTLESFSDALVGGKIKPHCDTHPSFRCGHRIHIPITTNPRVRFMIDGRPYEFEVGQAYEINNQKQHSVMNKGTEDRITFIFDYVPPGAVARAGQSEAGR